MQRYSLANTKEMFFTLLPAQVLSGLTSCLGTLVNGILVANYLSKISISALGLVNPLNMIITALSSIISGGSAVLFGRFIGSNRKDKLNTSFSNAIILTIFFGALFLLISQAFTGPIAEALGASDEIMGATINYIRGLSFGVLPTLLVPVLLMFLQFSNYSYLTVVSALILVVSNLLFSLFNIFYLNGGIFGMGLSTSLSEYLSLFVLIIFIVFKRDVYKPELLSFDYKTVKEIIILGSPGALSSVTCSLTYIYLNSMALKIGGVVGLSALAIINSLGGVYDLANDGISATVSSLSSIYAGEGDTASIKNLIKIAIKYGLIFGIATLCLSCVFGNLIISFFGSEKAISDVAYEYMLIYCLWMLVALFRQIYIGAFKALGKITTVNAYYIYGFLLLPIGSCFLLQNILGMKAIFSSFLIGESIGLCILYISISIKNRKPVTNLDDFLSLNEIADTKDCLFISVDNIEEVSEISTKVMTFLKDNINTYSKALKCGLCLEELAANVIIHGFKKGRKKKKYEVDIMVSIDKEGKVSMRLRDNAPYFDIRKKFGQDEDIEKNIGIRIVMKLAEKVDYQSSFNMNLLTIKL